MRPTEAGGIVLESRKELALALHTLSAAMIDIGAAVSSTQGHQDFKALSFEMADVLPREKVDSKEINSLELSDMQTSTLRDACKVAEGNIHFSLGVLTCFQLMTRLPEEAARTAAQQSASKLLRGASLIADTGDAASQLSGLLELYGSSGPLPTIG